jgi:hypothetical protein
MILVGSKEKWSLTNIKPIDEKMVTPTQIRTCVLIPATFFFSSRSKPIIRPHTVAIKILGIKNPITSNSSIQQRY